MMREDKEWEDREGIQGWDKPQLDEPTTKDFLELLGMLGDFQENMHNLRFDTCDEAMQHLNKLTSIINKFN